MLKIYCGLCSIHVCPVHCQNLNFVRNREEIIALKLILKVELILQVNVIELLQLVATFPISSFFKTSIRKVISSFFRRMSLVPAFYLTVNSCGSCCIFILSSTVVQIHAQFDSVHLTGLMHWCIFCVTCKFFTVCFLK